MCHLTTLNYTINRQAKFLVGSKLVNSMDGLEVKLYHFILVSSWIALLGLTIIILNMGPYRKLQMRLHSMTLCHKM
ncbi:hypothetical protein OMCYN_01395 [cyanobiont of Ornithocercus magnificus]|nr:hypothetical protein OMCYN_01395 [cyanobiont of Ornithocercus magnificus]